MSLYLALNELKEHQIYLNLNDDYLQPVPVVKKRSKIVKSARQRKPKFDEEKFIAYMNIITEYKQIEEELYEDGSTVINYTCTITAKSLFRKTLCTLIENTFIKVGIENRITIPDKNKLINIEIIIDRNDVGNSRSLQPSSLSCIDNFQDVVDNFQDDVDNFQDDVENFQDDVENLYDSIDNIDNFQDDVENLYDNIDNLQDIEE